MPAGSISVVMITRDRRSATIRSVGELRSPRDAPPVIVVDNGSTDGTAEALAAVDGVRVIRLPENLAAAGRNVGVAAASTPYVAFADDDSWWAPGSLTRAAELLDRHPRLGLVTGRVLVGPEQREDPLDAELAASPLGTDPGLPGPSVLGFLACAAVVRRSAFLEAGGFHGRYGVGGEEELLALDLAAAGWTMCYVPELVAHHHPAPSASRTGRSARQKRNVLWTAVLRRRPHVVARRVRDAAGEARRDPAARQALRETATALPWLLRERRPLPRDVERRARLLEGGQRAAANS